MKFEQCTGIVILVVTTLLLLSGCGDRSASGVYVSKGQNFASLLQLTETPDKRLEGSLIVVTVADDGQISHQQKKVSGVASDGTISLTIGGDFLSTTVGGKLRSAGLDLSGLASSGNIANEHFEKGTTDQFDEYASNLAALAAQAATARAIREGEQRRAASEAQAQQTLTAEAVQTVKQLDAVIARARAFADAVPKVRETYKGYARQANALLQTEQRLSASGDLRQHSAALQVAARIRNVAAMVRQEDNQLDAASSNVSETRQSVGARLLHFDSSCVNEGGGTSRTAIPAATCESLRQSTSSYFSIMKSVESGLQLMKSDSAQTGHELKRVLEQSDAMTAT